MTRKLLSQNLLNNSFRRNCKIALTDEKHPDYFPTFKFLSDVMEGNGKEIEQNHSLYILATYAQYNKTAFNKIFQFAVDNPDRADICIDQLASNVFNERKENLIETALTHEEQSHRMTAYETIARGGLFTDVDAYNMICNLPNSERQSEKKLLDTIDYIVSNTSSYLLSRQVSEMNSPKNEERKINVPDTSQRLTAELGKLTEQYPEDGTPVLIKYANSIHSLSVPEVEYLASIIGETDQLAATSIEQKIGLYNPSEHLELKWYTSTMVPEEAAIII